MTVAGRRQRDKDMIVVLVHRYRVSIVCGGHAGDELVALGVDHTQNRAPWIVAASRVVVIFARIEPHLVAAADTENLADDFTVLRFNHHGARWIGAANQQLLVRAEGKTARGAIVDPEQLSKVSVPGVDHRDRT